jgi:putative NADH-flavin reductase
MKEKIVLVIGAGGFIGHHLVNFLKQRDFYVRAVAIKKHDLSKPQEVRGRNSDNSELSRVLNWSPEFSLADGHSITYRWIESQIKMGGRLGS